MVPAPSAFSIPPIRCSRPGVPGMAQGRARVRGLRRNGRNSGLPSSPAQSFGLEKENSSRSLGRSATAGRSEEHTSELQSLRHLVCRLLLEKKKEGVGEQRLDAVAVAEREPRRDGGVRRSAGGGRAGGPQARRQRGPRRARVEATAGGGQSW